MQEHTGRVFRLQFDDFQIVSSSHDDTIIIWDFLDTSSPQPAESWVNVARVSLCCQRDGRFSNWLCAVLLVSGFVVARTLAVVGLERYSGSVVTVEVRLECVWIVVSVVGTLSCWWQRRNWYVLIWICCFHFAWVVVVLGYDYGYEKKRQCQYFVSTANALRQIQLIRQMTNNTVFWELQNFLKFCMQRVCISILHLKNCW